MLYNQFIICMMTCAFFAMTDMIYNQHWEYIILPIGIFIWGFFKFFDEDDREHLRRNGIDPDEYNAFFPDDYYCSNSNRYNSYKKEGNTITWNTENENGKTLYTEDYSRYQPRNRTYQNPQYKGMVEKCKRNFKITIDKNTKNEKKENKPFLHFNNTFRM